MEWQLKRPIHAAKTDALSVFYIPGLIGICVTSILAAHDAYADHMGHFENTNKEQYMSNVNKIIDQIEGADEVQLMEFDFKPLFVLMKDMESAMAEFVRRVDAGEVRSTKTYKRFKAVLGGLPPVATYYFISYRHTQAGGSIWYHYAVTALKPSKWVIGMLTACDYKDHYSITHVEEVDKVFYDTYRGFFK